MASSVFTGLGARGSGITRSSDTFTGLDRILANGNQSAPTASPSQPPPQTNPWASLTSTSPTKPASTPEPTKATDGGDIESQFANISRLADLNAGPDKSAELAGQAVSDVDTQFAGQEKAGQLRMSRMGLDPSQNASVTGDRQSKIAQAVARAGAMQGARRQAREESERSRQSAFQTLAGMQSQQNQQQSSMDLQNLRGKQQLESQSNSASLRDQSNMQNILLQQNNQRGGVRSNPSIR